MGVSSTGIAVNSAGTLVYVANTQSNNVSVINAATNVVAATVFVGSTPRGGALNPAGTLAYVSNEFSNGSYFVSVLDTAAYTVVAKIPIGSAPNGGLAINPAGTFAYLATAGNKVSVENTSTNAEVATIPVELAPFGVAVHPSGNFVYVALLFAVALAGTRVRELRSRTQSVPDGRRYVLGTLSSPTPK